MKISIYKNYLKIRLLKIVMPKTPIDYQTTVIYKIQHIEKDDLLYVGHTTNFTKRKNNHKCKCTKPDNSKYNLKI